LFLYLTPSKSIDEAIIGEAGRQKMLKIDSGSSQRTMSTRSADSRQQSMEAPMPAVYIDPSERLFNRDLDEDGITICHGDCNDNDPAIHPGAVEICGNKIDENCNGVVDEGSADNDGDGYAGCDDCNDNDPNINPGALEICNIAGTEKVDENCNGIIDTEDQDGDGRSTCADCDDTDEWIYFGHPEVCDGKDNDCNGIVDDDNCGCREVLHTGGGQIYVRNKNC